MHKVYAQDSLDAKMPYHQDTGCIVTNRGPWRAQSRLDVLALTKINSNIPFVFR